jgi:RHS repeat-associated protein
MAVPLDTDDRVTFLERLGPITVLGEADFDAALARASDPPAGERVDPPTAVDEEVRQRAARLAGDANDPASLGAIAELSAGRQPFASDVFLVVRDPVFDPDTPRVQFTDFSVAVVRLTGTASWTGHNVVLAVDTRVVGEPGRCCGPPTLCVPGPGPLPDPGWDPLAITEAVGRTGTAPVAADLRVQLGRPTIDLQIFDRRPSLGAGLPEQFPHVCTRVIGDPGCTVAKPVCDWDDNGFTLDAGGGGDAGAGSTLCRPGAGGTVTGRDVPEICQHIRSEENLPAECGGWCANCGLPYHARTGLPRFCQAAQPVPGGGSPCDRQTAAEQAIRNDRLRLEFGWTGPGDAGTRCTPSGRDGIEHCISCDAQGSCTSFPRRPRYDPTLADESSDSEIPTSDENVIVTDVQVTNTATGTRISGLTVVQGASGGGNIGQTISLGGIPSPTQAPPDRSSPSGGGEGPSGPTEPSGSGGTDPPDKGGRGWTNQFTPNDFSHGAGTQPTGGDPVDLGSGALRLVHTDLSFPGPTRPLALVRGYTSRSRQRSALGSNWTHSWDVWLRPLDADSVPDFLSPWCAGAEGQPTTVLLHDGVAGTELFVLDIATQLFLPQAGGASTLRQSTDGGWALRDPDGRVRVFNPDGYLTQDRDRFGSGFTVDYEPTPLWELFQRWCTPTRLTERGETLTSRRCWLLAWLVGAAERPDAPPEAWQVSAADFPVPGDVDDETASRLRYAAAYLAHLSAATRPSGLAPESLDGHRRLRPVAVVDDLGRRLEFGYATAPAGPGRGSFDFAARPDAGLLETVSGPSGSRISYGYDRPVAYPVELNELFLTRAVRDDGPTGDDDVLPAPTRIFAFEYAWPDSTGTRPAAYEQHRNTVEARYLAYFQTFTGCWYRDNDLCADGTRGLGTVRLAPGNPTVLARRAANDYVSEVADDILTVTDTGRIESESRYQLDPWQLDWERVTAQRFGSSSTVQANPVPDRPGDRWRTTLPKIVFDYVEAGPVAGGDRTDAFLPIALRDRFLLEDEPNRPPPAAPPQPVVTAQTPLGAGCALTDTDFRRRALPGWQERTQYYDPPPDERHPRPNQLLMRTRLAPDQLTDTQVRDPAHNDLVSTYVSGPAGSLLISRIVGGRLRTAWNANRICAWARMRDRDGDITYLGLNHRGDTLVTAVADASGYVVTERLVNADGRPVQERRPTRTPTPWTPAVGSTHYTYDEIDQAGERGWNSWLPVLWARRGNLLRIDELAPAPGVIDEDEATGTFGTSLGRYRRYAYEPLFNQVVASVEGALERRTGPSGGQVDVDVPHRTRRRLLDYQELSLTAPADDPRSIRPVLAEVEPWGFHWGRDATGSYDPAVIGWQLPLELYGADLNGDGAFGHRFATRPGLRAAGLPVLVLDIGDDPDDVQAMALRWSPHGQPTFVEGPDGEQEVYIYHPLSAPLGGTSAATVPDAGRRGMPASTTRSRFLNAYPTPWGPPGQDPCPGLAGPYQWLVPAATPSDQLVPALEALGLPPEAVADILATSDRSSLDAHPSVEFTWTVTGHLRRRSTETGDERFVTDVDGRIRVITDQNGTRTQLDFDTWGDQLRSRRFAADGTQIAEVRRTFDGAHHPLTEAVALEAGAFATPPTAARATRGWTWTGEELPATVTDPVGTVTTVRYDSHKRPVGILTTDAAGTSSRGTAWRYDTDGRLTETRHGALTDTDPGLVVEQIGYDGLGRVERTVDRRGVVWRHAWSQRDLPTRSRRSDVPYGAAVPVVTSWEERTGYDTHRRPVTRTINGVELERMTYSPGGRLLRESGEGRGITLLLPDATGAPIWQLGPDGTVAVRTTRSIPNRTTVATLRAGAAWPVTSTLVTDLDPTSIPLSETLIAAGIDITRSWRLDANRQPDRYTDHFGHTIEVRRNWAGWITQITEPRDGGAGDDVTAIEYDPRGWPHVVTDPAGHLTTYERNAFGEVESKTAAGQPMVLKGFGYDAVGCPETVTSGGVTRLAVRDSAGDVVRIEVVDPAGNQVLTTRSFDELGRVTRARHTNLGLTTVPAAQRLVTCIYTYDEIGRIASEEITVGSQPPSTVSALWLSLGDQWRRQVRAQTGGAVSEWVEDYDPAERLVDSTLLLPGGGQRAVTFDWLGDWYRGRTHAQPGQPSPLRERRDLDPFGLAEWVRWSVVDTDPARQPVHLAEGQQYCAGTWDPDVCAVPLLDLRYARDPIGRLGVGQWRWGNPRTSGGVLVTTPQDARWRGWTYTERHQLDATVELDLSAPPPLPGRYSAVTPVVLAAAPGTPWQYTRESAVGSVADISAGTQRRWRETAPRGAGFELDTVEVDRQARRVSHDDAGRVTASGRTLYEWHPDDRLALVRDAAGVRERYAYTADGRLVAVWGPAAVAPAQILSYDGAQMVAAAAGGVRAWEARWGPGLDQLIEWTDHIGGLGTVLPLIDESRSVIGAWSPSVGMVGSADYSPEGRIVARDADGAVSCDEPDGGALCQPPAGVPFGFAGAWRSAATGLSWMRQRWLDPRLAQFLSRDPLGALDGHNTYTYAAADPVNRRDPLGLGSTGPGPAVATAGPGLEVPGSRIPPPTPPPTAPQPPTPPPTTRPPLPTLAAEAAEEVAEEVAKKTTLGLWGRLLGGVASLLVFPHDDDLDSIRRRQDEINQEVAEIEARERLREQIKELTSNHDRPEKIHAPSSRPFEDPYREPPEPIKPMSDPRRPVPFLDPVPENPFEAPGADPSPPSLQAGRWSVKLVEGTLALRTPKAKPGQPHNKAGFLRHQQSFWREFLEQYPEAFSIGNMLMIEAGLAPIVDEVFTEFPGNQWMKGWLDAHLDHHHWDRGAWASGIPSPLHQILGGYFHRR